ncbi:hypothetical protein BDZ45DRAFT_745258 [Acephala macrosclerotiorum]|nr:hypothetical protein BDZ45DRAFT_745258 [Acephala macrosclerotiorum]
MVSAIHDGKAHGTTNDHRISPTNKEHVPIYSWSVQSNRTSPPVRYPLFQCCGLPLLPKAPHQTATPKASKCKQHIREVPKPTQDVNFANTSKSIPDLSAAIIWIRSRNGESPKLFGTLWAYTGKSTSWDTISALLRGSDLNEFQVLISSVPHHPPLSTEDLLQTPKGWNLDFEILGSKAVSEEVSSKRIAGLVPVSLEVDTAVDWSRYGASGILGGIGQKQNLAQECRSIGLNEVDLNTWTSRVRHVGNGTDISHIIIFDITTSRILSYRILANLEFCLQFDSTETEQAG